MGKRRSRRKATTERIEKFPFAGMTIRTFGKFLEISTDRTAKDQAMIDTHQAGMYEGVCRDIDGRVARIRDLLIALDPLALMQSGYWQLCYSRLSIEADHGLESEEDIIFARMVDYVQSLIVSTPPTSPVRKLTKEAWEELFQEVKNLYQVLYIQFFAVNSAHQKATQPDYDFDDDSFHVWSMMLWTSVRVHRYPLHNREFLQDFISPHDAVLRELFGIAASDLIEAINAVYRSLLCGGLEAYEELSREHVRFKRIFDEVGPNAEATEGGGISAADLWQDPERQSKMRAIGRRIAGLDLFDIQRIANLPPELLDSLSLGPGGDDSLFAQGPYRGWPLRVSPTRFKPFLKIAGRYYCFDFVNLMDDIYRAIERTVRRCRPAYGDAWKQRQTEVSERRPVEILTQLLPGATVYRNVHYQGQTGAGQKGDCELDALILYDDVMLIVEVKAGAFTWSSPANDFEAHRKSLKDLLLNPAKQAKRFLDYLETGESVPLCDRNKAIIGSVARRDYRLVIPLCLTLEELTTAACHIDRLKGAGIAIERPVCSMSIDDLRVMRDVFDSPVTFAHFLKKRYEVECEPSVKVDDQLEHIGLYLRHIDYVLRAKELSRQFGMAVENRDNARIVLDRYFRHLRVEDLPSDKPRLPIGDFLAAMIRALDASARRGRCKCAAALLEMVPALRQDFEVTVGKSLARSRERGQPSPFNIQGHSALTVFPDAPGIATHTVQYKKDYTFAWMMRSGGTERLLLTMFFDDGTELVAMDWQFLRLDDLTNDDRLRIAAISKEQAARRVATQLETGARIGRNDPCPCGSGKKHKKCCGKR